ncbi:MAG: DNA polymerase III subunit beta, partial [Epsilonproteobacteria bacterium]|nr:DNA polymerase III subunit beta [Campylobacterota bacterium]
PKYELNGALIDIKSQKSALVGTDTKRLAIAYIANKSERELSLIVPKKAIMEIQKLFFDEIEINYDENSLIVTNDNYFFYTRLINGKFPDYERIIPKSLKYEIKLPKKEMIDSIKMIAALSSDIKITFEATKIIFESLSSDNIEAKTSIDYETSINNPFTLAVNSKHILDFLTHIDSNSFTIGLNEPNLPFLLKEENFLTIIMPIIL